ncbi:MAG: DUF4190 domain-containing protein [Oscillospiraceae bacterium]|nr:DUF4190 domain-containing protein [Oscillospiraceae bacterium]MBR4092539.1 DUF4190 domain-containing protein [Oscillospiraceae bacterium]
MDNNFNNPYGTPEQQNYNYVQYEPENTGEKKSKGLAVASMVIGIVMFVLGCCVFSIIAVMTSTYTMLVPAVISLLGVILGIMSLVNKLGGKGMAIAGIVLNVLSFFACLYMLVSFITLNKSIEEVSGYTIQELFQAVSSGEMTQEEYNDILMDAEEALMEME